ncbi:4,5-DOPA dioxygenase extradiol [Acinetobacter qingfengensis]|uniref:4,5-DOPA dioxygenase extradiol n=1 Tax=Acinetobacter qingfengensis TaxID=1262585 RepID=A0A1E7RE72_9GAMM|nr:4,5-DOPA dioxygenase extradiol [Acinetobacter qingfengensis]KAA8734729.1 4,5-DOPA dioxygenase extradiol [Acinetobacter qingfengensis]OEY97648.1 4,5-DOPA dioxygenase extradiol [Acinetobacter qingfengensis]
MQNLNTLKDLSGWSKHLPDSVVMPVIFAGHGSPMNAIEDTSFAKTWRKMGQNLQPQPAAILCISAHWLTQGSTAITAMPEPATIHDFGGFPQSLFNVQYPAMGNRDLISNTIAAIHSRKIQPDLSWGLDHGTWSILVNMFPEANIPVVQLSIDYDLSAQQHYDLAKELTILRRKGVLIIASGNTVHNLRMLARHHPHAENFGYDWAIETDSRIKNYWLNHDHEALINWEKQGQAFRLAIPTPDHYYPMLYSLALQEDQDEMLLFNEGTTMGSLNMTSFILQQAF